MQTSVKTERITILGTPDFKAYLHKEAKKEGISVSQLVRQRCEKRPVNDEEKMLALLTAELQQAAKRAKKSLNKGIADAEKALHQLRGS